MVKVNDKLFGNEQFHNGEVIYKTVPLYPKTNTIVVEFEDNRDITNMLLATEYIRDNVPDGRIILEMYYLPYSRMDREIPEGDQIFSLKYFVDIINKQQYDTVVVLDLHSPISQKLLSKDSLVQIDLWDNYVSKVLEQYPADYLFYPDKGANEKYTELFAGKTDIPHFYGGKQRDLANEGKIIEESYTLYDVPTDLKGKKVLIVDDLVSMGGTAIVTARKLKEAGAAEVALWVAHCENGVFVGKVFATIPFAPPGESSDRFAGQCLVDKVFTAGTTPLHISGLYQENALKNLIVIKSDKQVKTDKEKAKARLRDLYNALAYEYKEEIESLCDEADCATKYANVTAEQAEFNSLLESLLK